MLRVRPKMGFLDNELLRMVRGLWRPFRSGDEVVLSDMRARVREVTADGRPAEVDFTFAVPLEDPSLLWTRLRKGGALAPWSPPAVGESEVLPSIMGLGGSDPPGQCFRGGAPRLPAKDSEKWRRRRHGRSQRFAVDGGISDRENGAVLPEGSRLAKAGTRELALTPIDATSDGKGRTEPQAAEWVRRARAGDGAAFGLLLDRYERMVLRTALRLLGQMDQAQDAAQETFLRMHRYFGRLDESRELGPWLYRVVVNACRDIARRRPAAPLLPLEKLRDAEQASTRGGPEEIEGAVSRAEQRRLVQEALDVLPVRERAAVVLRDIEGLSTAEVAQILGSSEGTVRSQVSTARVKIKRFVEAQRERGR